MVEAYPLYWPEGWPRKKGKENGRFQCTLGQAIREIPEEVRKLGGKNLVISTEIKTRRDGLPYASEKRPEDQGVAVYFSLGEKQMVFACDQYKLIEHNIWAIRKTIEALRGITRWGASEMLERAFSGFQQLEAPSENNWWEVLKVDKDCSLEKLNWAWKQKLKAVHPDKGGSNEQCVLVNKAYDVGKKYINPDYK